ncbi:MAG: hypothetical protein HC799_13220 [Limnothrix sp. RL_2_0]|nr:hypothetical protein [Limnothrix sp. RL_2_0]
MNKYPLTIPTVLVTFSQSAIAQTITPAPDSVGSIIQYNGNTDNLIRQLWTDPIEETEALTDELEVE